MAAGVTREVSALGRHRRAARTRNFTKIWKASGHVDGFSDPYVECVLCDDCLLSDTLRQSGIIGKRTIDSGFHRGRTIAWRSTRACGYR